MTASSILNTGDFDIRFPKGAEFLDHSKFTFETRPIVHNIEYINEFCVIGQYFLSDIIKEDVFLYELEIIPYGSKVLTPTINARDYFFERYELGFLKILNFTEKQNVWLSVLRRATP